VGPSGAPSTVSIPNDKSRKGLVHERKTTDSAIDILRGGRGARLISLLLSLGSDPHLQHALVRAAPV
jgi:hypothetical protein